MIPYAAPHRQARAPWRPDRSDYVILWHGCTSFDKDDMEANGIDLARCRVDTDFGRGYYTTTRKRQAEKWAWSRYYDWRADPANLGRGGNGPVVMRFKVRRYGEASGVGPLNDGLDSLWPLFFVLGDFDSEDYWSLVQHCRQSVPADPGKKRPARINDHKRPPGGWYDVVAGPVAARWRQRAVLPWADQVSFHTPTGLALLNALIDAGLAGNTDLYGWVQAP